MQIENRPINEIQPYGRNAKKHNDKQVIQIAESIKTFGMNQPLVVDKEGVIIVGHGRFLAAHFLGLKEVPVLVVDIDEEKAKAYRLADNKLNESEWDMQLVISELKELSMEMVDLTGFDRKLVLNSDDGDDNTPELPAKAKSKLGDLYEMGGHRLLCGDLTKEEDYIKLMKGVKADMVFTDPPYNIDYHGSGKNTSNSIMNDNMGSVQFRQFLIDAFKNIRASIKASAGLYVFHSPTTQREFEEALLKNEMEVKTQLIWNKPHAGLGMGHYRSKHEPFFYAKVKDQTPNFYGDRTNTTVIDFQKTDEQLMKWAKKQREADKEGRNTIWTMKREPVQDYKHPTQKPVELVMYALHNISKVDDIILDPFIGSGSTLIACEKTNRICYGLELDPRYCDVIVERYVNFTNNNQVIKNGDKITW